MLKIAHRGLLNGPDSTKENTIAQINLALKKDYAVELDIRLIDGKLYLGHDSPQELIDISFLENPKIWTHCKDKESYDLLKHNEYINCFTHGDEDYATTSRGYIWGHAKKGKFIYEHYSKTRVVIIAQYKNDWELGG